MVSTGGYSFSNSQVLASKSSFTFDGEAWSSGIVSDLPEGLGWQCLIKLDKDELLAVGGADQQTVPSSSTFFYNGRKDLWTKGPSLSTPRYI